MENITILLADDHVLLRQGTRELLEREDDMIVVGEAGDGEEAVRLTAELHPHVIVMDIAMPKVNGIEATRRIKEILSWRTSPFYSPMITYCCDRALANCWSAKMT